MLRCLFFKTKSLQLIITLALMETAFCKFSFATSADRLAYPCRLDLCTAYHLQASQAQLLCWGNTTRLAAGLCWHRPTGKINSPAVGRSKAGGGCNHHVTLESSFMSSPTSFCDWAAQFWKSWYPLPSALPATRQILLRLSETTELAITLEEVTSGPRGTRIHSVQYLSQEWFCSVHPMSQRSDR